MSRVFSALVLFTLCLLPAVSFAQSASEIQAKIDAQKQQMDALKAEIEQYQQQLDVIGAKKNTLQSTVNSLTLSQKQLASQIQLTQTQISSANLDIQKLSFSIQDKESSITSDKNAIAKALRTIAEGEQRPLVTQLVSADTFGEAWQVADQAVQFNQALSDNINRLRETKTALASNRDEVSAKKAELVKLQSDLTQQKRSVDASKAAQQKLLTDTQNQESNYQNLIAQKQAAGKAFEEELASLQGQLQLIVHPELLPKVGAGVISWPFSKAFMDSCAQRKKVFGNPFCITQYFGDTAFSTSNPQLYKGKGHNGIDIGAPIGTPLHAALGGVVLDTGNTDLVKGCYSFGKWIMIIHGNGLNTLYSHLSTIDVTKGQSVSAGQIVGLSGMTGSATGPHLHFGVYATEGTQIMTLKQFRNATTACANAKMPVATLDAYLNPLSYL